MENHSVILTPGQHLDAFLEASLITSGGLWWRDGFFTCNPDYVASSYLAVAWYRVLEVQESGDTAIAAAEVLSVAEEVGSPREAYGKVTTVRVKTDTLRWKMTRFDDGSWGVCGYSVEDYGLGNMDDGRMTEWDPPGWSWPRVRALADSIRRARERS